MKDKYDVIIVGTGVAGCFAALHFPESYSVLLITKAGLEESDSFLAQGGISVRRNDSDSIEFARDTFKAGHYENNPETVEIMVNSSTEAVKELIGLGVRFDRGKKGYSLTREGGHSINRILHYKDTTGKEITSTLLSRVKERSNIEIRTYTTMVDILSRDNTCYGILMETDKGEYRRVLSTYVVLATGGLGGIYENTTNYTHLTGDAIAIALRNNIKLKDIDYVQIHPTTLYSEKCGQSFLISESVRGEGAVLLNKNGERFVDELLPRDQVTKAILAQMEADGMPHVWLSMKDMKDIDISERFPGIYERCVKEGHRPHKDYIPVVPAQHYLMGGIEADKNGLTSMEGLYAVGETANIGIHGANRLASNSLLESIVFAKRAALDITGKSIRNTNKRNTNKQSTKKQSTDKRNTNKWNTNEWNDTAIDFAEYTDKKKFMDRQRQLVLETIRKEQEKRNESGYNRA